MPVQSADQSHLFAGTGAGTLRLIVYLALAAAIMASDLRFGFLRQLRAHAGVLATPIYWVASAPKRLGLGLWDAVRDRDQLLAENQELRQSLLLGEAKLARFDSLLTENESLRALLDARQRIALKAQVAELVDVDLDPFRQRLLLNRGSAAGITSGQAVIDARGLIGQVLETTESRATVIMITDPAHAVPVKVERTGLRAIAYGTGDADRLELSHVPFSADIVKGDRLLTSGIGGKFPNGLPVAVVTDIRGDDSATFAIAEARPVAALDQANQLLVLEQEMASISVDEVESQADFIGPPQGLSFPDQPP